jgi:glutathione S-transferase
MLAESWDIAEYLDRAYPAQPLLFSGAAELAMVRLMDAWFSSTIMLGMFRIYALDIYHAARPADRAYFRQSREAHIQTSLEELASRRTEQLPALRQALQPLRMQLRRFPFLGGDRPNYADYIGFGAFQWVASVSTLPLLAADDAALQGWLERGFGLYGGLGRDSRQRPLFEQRA